MSLLPSTIVLIDRSQPLVDRWRESFADCAASEAAQAGRPAVEVLGGDYFQRQADAIVSPANSFGIMDGGLDLAIRNELGFTVESRIQEVIVAKYHGELPVGSAEIVETGDRRWPYMVAAPTMRIPMPIGFTFNAYLAFRAVLVAIENFNRSAGRQVIDSSFAAAWGPGSASSTRKNLPAKCGPRTRP